MMRRQKKEAAKGTLRRLQKGHWRRCDSEWRDAYRWKLTSNSNMRRSFRASNHARNLAILRAARRSSRPIAPRRHHPAHDSIGGRPVKKWPSYAFCVQHAPMSHGEDRPDISRADFTWCRTAIEWGWGVQETANRLMELSGKAKENGQGYAILTATNAAASVEATTAIDRRGPPDVFQRDGLASDLTGKSAGVHICKAEGVHMRTIAVTINKGGVGKTTLTKSLATAATDAGLNVLILDMDTQENAASWGRRSTSKKKQIVAPYAFYDRTQSNPGTATRGKSWLRPGSHRHAARTEQ